MADALTGEIINPAFFALFRQWVDDVVSVDEDALAHGIYWMLAKHGHVIEGGAAAGIAAALQGAVPLDGRQAAIAVTGAGIDSDTVLEVVRRFA